VRDLETYVDRILEVADLAPRDARRVRAELDDHLQEIVALGKQDGFCEEEIIKMATEHFGDPTTLGKAIARAKGRFRTYLKKEARKLPITLAVVVVLVVCVRAVAWKTFYAETDAISPAVMKGDRLLINKLASDFRENDVVIYREGDQAKLALVKRYKPDEDKVLVGRNNEATKAVDKDKIVGRAILQIR